tara:strand:- start:51 stop:980 length:930 start_codon:yes stop_codon:yes gene_type:complete
MKFLKIVFLIFFLIPKIGHSLEVNIKYIVENNTITNVDIKNEINYLLLINNKLSELKSEILVEYSVKSLLREKIKEIELKKSFLFGENDDLINKQLMIFKKNLNINNNEEFNNLLFELGLSKDFIKKKIEIEILWNKLIYEKFISQVYIDQDKMKNELQIKLNNSNNKIKEYLIYEILFNSNTKNELDIIYKKIMNSIDQIGFENTASILSISDSSQFGGKIGWVNENQLSLEIIEKIKNLKELEISEPIITPNGILILTIKEQREINKKISFDDELQKMINSEAEKQLDQYSQIFFKKLELNTKVYEN